MIQVSCNYCPESISTRDVQVALQWHNDHDCPESRAARGEDSSSAS